MPLASDAVTTVLLSARLDVAVLVLLVDHGLGREGLPAVAVGEGCVWMTSLLAVAGLTTIVFDTAGVRPAAEKSSVRVSAVSSERSENVAMPPTRSTISSPGAGRCRWPSDAVTTVVLSPVSRLPYRSSSSMTGWIAKACRGRRRRRLRLDHQLAGRPGLDDDGTLAAEFRPPPVNPSVMVPTIVVGEAGERGHAALQRDRGRALRGVRYRWPGTPSPPCCCRPFRGCRTDPPRRSPACSRTDGRPSPSARAASG